MSSINSNEMVTVDPDNIRAILTAQFDDIGILQEIKPYRETPIIVKAIAGKWDKGKDFDLYGWKPAVDIWQKLNEPIYTRGILPNEILIDPDITDWQAMTEGVRKLRDYCNKNGIPINMAFSGGKGIHCSIFIGNIQFDNDFFNKIEDADIDVFKTVRKALVVTIAEKANVNLVSIGIDWGKINFNSTSKGSQVRTFGTTRAPGLYKTLIQEIPRDKPEPYELPLVFPNRIETWGINKDSEFYNIVTDALIKEAERAKAENEFRLETVDCAGIEITKVPCIKNLFAAGLKNGRFYAGEAVLLISKKAGLSKEESEKNMQMLYKTFPTITQAETEVYINNALSMYETKNFSCRTLKEHFPNLNLCDCSKCPIINKFNIFKQKKHEAETSASILN